MWSQKNHVTKRQFPNYFWFHPPVLQGPFTRWVNNKVKWNTSHLSYIFSITFKTTLLYPISQKRFEIMVAATLRKNLGPPMPKRSNASYLQENQELQTKCTLSMTCQINVVNKQHVPPLKWNNPFSKTYWWLNCRNVDPDAKYTPM